MSLPWLETSTAARSQRPGTATAARSPLPETANAAGSPSPETANAAGSTSPEIASTRPPSPELAMALRKMMIRWICFVRWLGAEDSAEGHEYMLEWRARNLGGGWERLWRGEGGRGGGGARLEVGTANGEECGGRGRRRLGVGEGEARLGPKGARWRLRNWSGLGPAWGQAFFFFFGSEEERGRIRTNGGSGPCKRSCVRLFFSFLFFLRRKTEHVCSYSLRP